MSQISLYIDDETLAKAKKAAKMKKTSLSKYVVKVLNISFNEDWPDGYFELFGSIADETFSCPNTLSFNDDIKRESL